MGRALESRGFLKRNFFLIAVSTAYVAAALNPLWGLGWDSPALIPWTAATLSLLAVSAWRLLRPGRPYPSTDFGFVIPLILAVNLFSTLLGPDRQWLQPMNFLVVALCALYYSIGFNFAVAGLIFLLEGLNLAASPGEAGLEPLISLAVFGAYLAGAVLVLGRIFKSEHRKREKAMRAVKRLQEGAMSLEHTGDPAIGSVTPEGRIGRLVDSAAQLDGALTELLATARAAIPAENALFFMSDRGGENLYLRVHLSDGGVMEDCTIRHGQGLVGWVASEKKPILVNDAARNLGYLEKETPVRSFLAAPVFSGTQVEGVISLDSPEEDAFSELDREAMGRFAGIAAYLLQNAREFHQVDLAAQKFTALHKISSELSSSLDIDEIIEKLADFSREILPYDYLTVSFTDGDDAVRFKSLKGYKNLKSMDGPVPLSKSWLSWIVENRQPLSLNDLDQKLPIFPVKELQTDCRSFLGIPFVDLDSVLGVMTFAMKEPDAISGYQQHMLSIIANQVAVNIANASLHQTMQMMATTDGLTGLTNHRHFQEMADAEFSRAARYPVPLSVLLFDIDHFKKVNDTYGHPVGDAVLKKVAKVLLEAVRAADVAARYGGEEFVALLVNTDEGGALKMAERIRTTVEKSRFTLEGRHIPVTVSIGVAAYPQDAGEKKLLIEKADQALYWAKGHGRNRCCTYRSIAAAAGPGVEAARK